MGNIITPGEAVQQPYDKYWDSPPTRREIQRMANKLGSNDAELMAMCDTAALVLNFLCERFGVKREEIDAYVKIKSEEVKALRAKLQAEAEAKAKVAQ